MNTSDDSLREMVFSSLSNAVENGYCPHNAFGEADEGETKDKIIERVCVDTATYDAELEAKEIEELKPHVEAWFAEHATCSACGT